jgi:ParB-like chromosome segregation protein Spo0J
MNGAAKKTDVPAGIGSAESNSGSEAAGSEVSIDAEQLQREARAFAEQMLDWVGRDTPEGRAMLRDLERELAPLPRPTTAQAEETRPQSAEASVDRPTTSSSADTAAAASGSISPNPAHRASASGVGQIDFEQIMRQLDPADRALINNMGRDTPEAQGLLRGWARDQAAIPRPIKAEDEETLLIDLRLLKESPLHHRTAPSAEERTALARSIGANGLEDPIEVRPDGDKFEIIRGHRRVDAYRTLLGRATTESERAKYQAIRAKVVSVSDGEAVRRGIAGDLMREEFSPADASKSIHVLQELEPQLDTAAKVSEATGLPPRRVRRYLQLDKSSAVVQEAARRRIIVRVEEKDEDDGETGEGAREEQRKLDLLPALEFSRLHAALSKRQAADDSADESDQADADQLTREAIERALTEGWSFREVKRYVDKAIGAPKRNGGGRPRLPFKWKKQRLEVDVSQLDALDAAQKAELRKVIEDILRRL